MTLPCEWVSGDRPVQIHVAPIFLEFDRRADQIFIGFSSTELAAFIKRRFHGSVPTIQTSKGDVSIDLIELSNSGAQAVRVLSTDSENPGGVAGVRMIVDRLLGEGGCPWDQAQTHLSLCKHLVEETYELVEAIESGDPEAFREELGDVLLQPIMHGQMSSRAGRFDIDDIADQLADKLVRRHPHVFGGATVTSSADALTNWDSIKKAERRDKKDTAGILGGVPKSMPALLRALEISKRAARAGFEWENLDGVWDKFKEEEIELREAIGAGNKSEVSNELGDLLFTLVNLARWLEVDPEASLRTMVMRFQARFRAMENLARVPLTDLSPAAWELLWTQAKALKLEQL